MNKTSGVFTAQKKDGSISYRSSITYQNKHISLGSFSSFGQAHAAYKEAERLLRSKEPAALSDYGNHCALSFEKWVVLLNFRNNGVYFSTPIYVRPHFFLLLLYKRNCIEI